MIAAENQIAWMSRAAVTPFWSELVVSPFDELTTLHILLLADVPASQRGTGLFDRARLPMPRSMGDCKNASSVADETSGYQVPLEGSPASYRTEAERLDRTALKHIEHQITRNKLRPTSAIGNRHAIPSMLGLLCSLGDRSAFDTATEGSICGIYDQTLTWQPH
jgi:hypothetical protein